MITKGNFQVLLEIATLLQNISKARGEEAFSFFVNVFLPSQSCPPDVAVDFATKMRDMDLKSFRKFFADFVRASRQ
jgi:exportin-T